MSRRGRAARAACASAIVALMVTMPGDVSPVESAADRPRGTLHDNSRTVSAEERADAIARAQLWRAPDTPARAADLGRDPRLPSMVVCRFTISDLGGTTPKFHCILETGTEVRVKYGRGEEIPAEAAATRLLAALGFGADTVTTVERLRCYGCPKEPFVTMKIVEATRTTALYEHVVNHEKYEEFPWVAMEEKFKGIPIESKDQKGWAFFELDGIDPSKGGAPREQVDALRLLAVFLAHWDNKADNQRLVCLSDPWPEGTRCREPFLLLQDIGSTFGPSRLELEKWERAMIWEDRLTCTISMRDMPYSGGTFGSARISERGRQFLLRLLGALNERQLTDLFSGARFDQHDGLFTESRPASEWVRVFRHRVKLIGEGPPCPST